MHAFFLWKIGLEAYGLRSLSIWWFIFRSDQTFVVEIVVGKLSWWKQTSQFCRTHPCKLLGNFFAILSFSRHKNWSDLSFPPDILVSYFVFEIYYVYIISLWKFGLVAYGLRFLSIWGFTFESDQTFMTKIVASYW